MTATPQDAIEYCQLFLQEKGKEPISIFIKPFIHSGTTHLADPLVDQTVQTHLVRLSAALISFGKS